MTQKKAIFGKMEVMISKVTREEYDRIVSKVNFLCLVHRKKYHAKFTPYSKPKVKK